jgi:hypothetical protein
MSGIRGAGRKGRPRTKKYLLQGFPDKEVDAMENKRSFLLALDNLTGLP